MRHQGVWILKDTLTLLNHNCQIKGMTYCITASKPTNHIINYDNMMAIILNCIPYCLLKYLVWNILAKMHVWYFTHHWGKKKHYNKFYLLWQKYSGFYFFFGRYENFKILFALFLLQNNFKRKNVFKKALLIIKSDFFIKKHKLYFQYLKKIIIFINVWFKTNFLS